MARPKRPSPEMSKSESPSPRYGLIAIAAIGGVAILAIGGLLLSSGTPQPPDIGGNSFATSGEASAADLFVEGSEIDMGVVPLNVTVTPTWTIINTGAQTLSLGEPHASVIEGCCPGPLLLDATELGPGASATLAFPLQMHEGMDGPHRFDIHVPIAGSDSYLTLAVAGDFQG